MIELLAAGNEARNFVTGIVDRFIVAHHAKLDAKALRRLLILEARRNLAVMSVAFERKRALSDPHLWGLAEYLGCETLELVLGPGAASAKVLAELRSVKPTEHRDEAADNLASNLWVRISALRALASLQHQHRLPDVRIGLRLKNLRTDLLTLIQVLEPQS